MIDFCRDPKTWVFLGPLNVANFGREMGSTPAISGTSRLVKSYHHLPRLMGDGFSPSCIRGPCWEEPKNHWEQNEWCSKTLVKFVFLLYIVDEILASYIGIISQAILRGKNMKEHTFPAWLGMFAPWNS